MRPSKQATGRLPAYVNALAREKARRHRARLEEEKQRREERKAEVARLESSLAEFTRAAWEIIEPGTPLVWNWHLDTICGYLEAVAAGHVRRLIINVPPGSMKSILVAVMFPAWVWARQADKRFLAITNEQTLALDNASKMHLVVESEWFTERWPVQFSRKQDAKTLFKNTALGSYQSIGITGRATGKRGNFLIIDDPHDAEKAFSDKEINRVTTAFDQKLSNRLNNMDKDAIILIMQRLRTTDLTAHLLKKKELRWTHLKIPMEYKGQSYDAGADIGRPELNDPRKRHGELMFPKLFGPKTIASEKEIKGEYGYVGQYQQEPVPLEGGIIKSKWWKVWPADKPFPEKFIRVFTSWDTAFSDKDKQNNAFTAFTKWGLFWNPETKREELLLLKEWHGRVGYDEMRERVKKEGSEAHLDFQLIERKATGLLLIPDLRRARAKVKGFLPDKYGDKTARLYTVSPKWQAGYVWMPPRKWAETVRDLVATAPDGDALSKDIGDTCSQAVLYMEALGFMRNPDETDDLTNDLRKKYKPDDEDDDDDDDNQPKGLKGLYG